jgi:two-component system response regulator DevR
MFVEALDRILGDVPEIDVIGHAGTRAIAVELARDLRPDVATVDSSLPLDDAIPTASEMHDVSPDTRMIMLAETVDNSIVPAAMEAGFVGFLTKDKGIKELVAAVRLVFEGNAYLAPEILTAVIPSRERSRRMLGSDLTAREREILDLMAAGGLGNKDIAIQLRVSHHTVRNHVQSVLAKLGAHSKLEAVVIAAREGLLGRPRSAV